MAFSLGMALGLGSAGCVLALSAQAAAPTGCFVRQYDKAHLAAHPGQTVTHLSLSLKPLANPEPFVRSAELDVIVRGKKVSSGAVGDCTVAGAGLDCPMDEDAGSFTLTSAAHGALLLTVTASVRLARADVASEETPGPFLKMENPEDRSFLLSPAQASACH
jgi:hypothetical protein